MNGLSQQRCGFGDQMAEGIVCSRRGLPATTRCRRGGFFKPRWHSLRPIYKPGFTRKNGFGTKGVSGCTRLLWNLRTIRQLENDIFHTFIQFKPFIDSLWIRIRSENWPPRCNILTPFTYFRKKNRYIKIIFIPNVSSYIFFRKF